jgi:Glycosyl hydrolase family 12
MRAMRARLALTLLLTVTLNGCGGGAAGDSLANPPMATVTTLTCLADASASTVLGRLHNNTWNRQAAGVQPWQQCLVQRGQGATLQVGWQWQWPTSTTTVLAYPSLVVGAKPWESGPGNDARFPRAIARTSRLVLDFELDTSATGSHSLAASMWLIRTPTVASPPVVAAISGELLVTTSTSGADWTAGRTPLALVTISGIAWQLWYEPNWSDASGGSAHRWPLVAYTAVNPTTRARLDLRQFLADAGSGSTWINAFSLEVN